MTLIVTLLAYTTIFIKDGWTAEGQSMQLLDYINDLYKQYLSFANLNPIAAGMLSVWALGVLTYLAHLTRNYFKVALKRHFTIEITINSDDAIFYEVVKWFESIGFEKKTRTLQVGNGRGGHGDRIYAMGYGIHFFFFNKRIFFIKRSKDNKGNYQDIKETLVISTYGRSMKPIISLLELSKPLPKIEESTSIYFWDESRWRYHANQPIRDFDTVYIEKEKKDLILNHITGFIEGKYWYHKNGIPYRTGICLFGPPGTGKTSLVRAICAFYKYDLYYLNLSSLSDKMLSHAISEIDEKGVVLIEDIDTYQVTSKRDSCLTDDNNEDLLVEGTKSKDSKEKTAYKGTLTLSGILNAIDGVASSDGRILIITTNNLSNIDPALIRPGRIDLKIKVNYLNHETLCDAFMKIYPNFNIPPFRINGKLTASEFQSYVMQYKNDPQQVFDLLHCKGHIMLDRGNEKVEENFYFS